MNRVFLSYSAKDAPIAAAIREVLRRLGFKVWWPGGLSPSSEWFGVIGRALKRCDSMVVVVSPRAMESEVVMSELRYAATHDNFRFRIFPALVEPTPRLPWLFSIMQVFDLTRDQTRGLKSLAQAIREGENRTPPQARPGPSRATSR